ncbi:MAG TPA: L,D-transpeptidase [Bryobacteraceae bacterium]|nr:L,D-transpeptidase [Bryobacteraceae bacterium]
MNGLPISGHQTHRFVAALFLAAATALARDKQCGDCRIVISIPDHKLVLLEGDHLLRAYEIASGKPSTPSPRGDFRIVNRVAHPVWYGPHGAVRPGASNPLGTRWMGLSVRGYGIHGTNAPKSIGHSDSHGCIRMRNADVENLFDLVDVGVPVQLLAEPSADFRKLLSEAD